MFDLDVILPACQKFKNRLEDFKRYGLVNLGGRSVRVNLIVSGENFDGLKTGWPNGVSVNVNQNNSTEYVANIYRFYLTINHQAPDFKWLIRLDDDSCTDVNGLVTNLDKFYGHENPYCLGDLHPLQNALNGLEGGVYQEYKELLGDFLPFSRLMMVEIECGVLSKAAAKIVLSNPSSRALIERRSCLNGGYGDSVVALASAMARVYPTSCPFITHEPFLHEFSLLGGIRNHIHMISRNSEGENFWHRITPENYDLLIRLVEGGDNPTESRLKGKRILIESNELIRVLEFKPGHIVRTKPEDRVFNWYGSGDEAIVLDAGSVVYRLKTEPNDVISCEGFTVTRL